MNPHQRTLAALAFSAALLAGTTSTVRAQTATATPAAPASSTSLDQEMITLSPFEVTSRRDDSYQAESTLAGNRLNTKLRDVGSAISVVTAQMLRDIGATSNESLLQYTTNTEVGSVYGNMANAGSGTQLDETRSFVAPNTNTRVRGLAAADNTIDFFLTDIPWDGYNVDRVDFQRGPNAILFGLGSPAGIINAGTKQANFRGNKGQIEFRIDRFGSQRSSLDYNQVLITDQLAARIDLLNNDEKFQQDPAFQHDRRLYGTVRYEPGFLNKGSAHTTLRANYETGKIRSNRPRNVPPGDSTTMWFDTGTVQGYNSTTGAPVTYNNLNRMGFDARGLMDQQIASTGVNNRGQFVQFYADGTLNPNWQPWLGGQFAGGYFGNPQAIFENGAGSGARFVAQQPFTPRGINTAGTIDGNITGIPDSRMSSITGYRDYARKIGLPGAIFGLTRNLVITDPTVFDFYNLLIDGDNKREWQNFNKFNVSLAQTFLDGNVGVEAVYDKQQYDNGQLVFMSDKSQAIFVDVIQTLADGAPNPNFGRPFIGDSAGNNRATTIDREAKRFTAFVQYDFDRGNHRNWLTRAVGRHILTGFYNDESRKADSRGWLRYGTDLSYKDFVTTPASVATIDSSTRAIFPVIYLGPSLASRTTASGAYIPNASGYAVAKTGSVRVFDSTWAPAAGINPGDVWTNTNFPVGNTRRISTQAENPANYRGWTNIPFNVLDSEEGNRNQLTTSAQLTKSTVESDAAVWNGYFFGGALVGMYGYREDISKAWTFTGVRNNQNQVNLDSSSYRLPERYRDRIKEQSKSWSVVAHLTEFFPKMDLPVELSVFYNKSENFAASAGRVGPLNENLGPPKGNTTDYGFVVRSKDGKYSLKLNKYESVLQNASSSGFNLFYLAQLWTDYNPWKNVFKQKIDSGFDLSTTQGNDPTRWTWQPRLAGQTQAQADAEQAASIAAWETLVAQVPAQFFQSYQIDINRVSSLTYVAPAGLTVTEDNVSKGYEAEFFAQPVKDLRLTVNVSKSDAIRSNVGQESILNLVNIINTALNNTPAGLMRTGASGTSTPALTSWNNNFYAPYASIKQQEGGNVPENRKWRANFIANYDFTKGFMKGVNIGGGYRWQDKIILGYVPIYTDVNGNVVLPQLAKIAKLDLQKPFYGPAETNVDFWIGYKRALNSRLTFRTQLNVRNVGKGNELIPVTVQPDGKPAAWRIAPTQVWTWTNTLEF